MRDVEAAVMATARHDGIEVPRIRMLPDGRMDARNAAAYVGLAEKTLASMRSRGTGPRYIKRGRIFYFKADLDEWLNAEGRLGGTAQDSAARP